MLTGERAGLELVYGDCRDLYLLLLTPNSIAIARICFMEASYRQFTILPLIHTLMRSLLLTL